MPPRPGQVGAPEDPWVNAGLVILAGVLGVAVVVWGIAQLAALAFGGGALSTGVGQMPGVLARLPGAWSDPAAAWPAADRCRLPGPVAFYAVAGAVVAVLVSVGLGAATLARRRLGARVSKDAGARW
ncbi:MAG: hypothetical protein AB7V23_11470, partial [Candidatus Nanopelagicales bacterium]